MGRVLWAATVLILAFGEAAATSFDCARATSRVERAICGDPLLSEFDDALADWFRSLIAQASSPETLRDQQRRWLKTRDACRDNNCIRAAYRSRLAELATRESARDGFWTISERSEDRTPESERLHELLRSHRMQAPWNEYLDIGDGTYFIRSESAGLFYAVLPGNVLLPISGGEIRLVATHQLTRTERLFFFRMEYPIHRGVTSSGYLAIVIGDPSAAPAVTRFEEVGSDSGVGICGSPEDRTPTATRIDSYRIADLNQDGIVDIEVQLSETNCATAATAQRTLRYLYSAGGYRELRLTRP